MRKKIFLLLTLLLLAGLLLLTGCDKQTEGGDTPPDPSTPVVDPPDPTKPNGNASDDPSTTPGGGSSSDDPSTTPGGAETTKTSKGYTITTQNGVTTIDGVLIANKTYTLPEDYDPDGLTDECDAAFNRMAAAAHDDGITLWNQSGYRSYALQTRLYNEYSATDGQAAADRYSARPGHSEHQSGLAIDLNTIADDFGDTAEGKWVVAHCADYGFILRYPQGKEEQTGYLYEPWHIRYVGGKYARAITDSGLCLEEYFGITSVYAA